MIRSTLAFLLTAFLLPAAARAGAVRGELPRQALSDLPSDRARDGCFWRLGPAASSPQSAPALVVLESPAATNLPSDSSAPATLTFEGYGLWPETITVRVGSLLRIRNLDGWSYSCRVEGGPDAFELGGLKAGETREHKLLASGVLQVHCDSLPFLHAAIVVTDSPLVAAADAEGRFQLRNVPAGNYQARVFAGQKWRWKKDIHVTAAGVSRLEFGTDARQEPADEKPAAGDQAAVSPAPVEPPPRVDRKPPVAERTPPAAEHKPPPAADRKPPAADRKPPVADRKPPVAATKPPAAAKKPPAAVKKPPVEKKPPAAAKKPPQKKPGQKGPEPAFKDVEPEIEIEIEE